MDDSLSLALKEAYASAPTNVVIYHTIELRHPAFTSPIRVVRDSEDLSARLELSAPVDAGEVVQFVAFGFDFTKPEVSATGLPQVSLEIDNVDRSIVANIEAALGSTELVELTYREFLSTDLVAPSSAPQNNPPVSLTIMSVTADVFKIRAVAGFPNFMNKRFPRVEYSADVFKALQ